MLFGVLEKDESVSQTLKVLHKLAQKASGKAEKINLFGSKCLADSCAAAFD